MVNKKDLKLGAVVAGSVILAGFIMYQFRDVGLVAQARAGFSN